MIRAVRDRASRFLIRSLFLILLFSNSLGAQELPSGSAPPFGTRKWSLAFDAGVFIPSGDQTDMLSEAGGVEMSVAHRFWKSFGAELGIALAAGAADISRSIELEGGGGASTGDQEVFLIIGGKWWSSLLASRLTLTGGVGYAFAYYEEVASAGPNTEVICTSCEEAARGKGPVVSGEISYHLRADRRLGITLNAKSIWISGDDWFYAGLDTSELDIPGPQDRWLKVAAGLRWYF